jgi:hypothetical protein
MPQSTQMASTCSDNLSNHKLVWTKLIKKYWTVKCKGAVPMEKNYILMGKKAEYKIVQYNINVD